LRVLVALEDDYRAYREMLATVLRVLRPHSEVHPQVVICGGHEDVEPDDRAAWIEVSLDPTQPTKINVGRRSLELTDPTVEELLSVIDELRVTHQY
jgi:hypothetical protein